MLLAKLAKESIVNVWLILYDALFIPVYLAFQ